MNMWGFWGGDADPPTSYDSDNDPIDPRWCVNHVPVDTGFGSSYCKRCDTSLEFRDMEWRVSKRNKQWRNAPVDSGKST